MRDSALRLKNGCAQDDSATTSVSFQASGPLLALPQDTSWAVRDAAEWEQNQAGGNPEVEGGLRESFARPETAQFSFPFLEKQIPRR